MCLTRQYILFQARIQRNIQYYDQSNLLKIHILYVLRNINYVSITFSRTHQNTSYLSYFDQHREPSEYMGRDWIQQDHELDKSVRISFRNSLIRIFIMKISRTLQKSSPGKDWF